MMSSNEDKLKETKIKEGVEVIPTPTPIKEKIVAESIKEEDKTSGDLIKIMRKKISESANSVVVESHQWEALCKMFQVLQIQSKDSDLDDVTLNILQNITNILKINIPFTEDGLCEAVDFSDYEGEDVEIKISVNTEISLPESIIADLLVFLNDFDMELSGTVARINPKLYTKIKSISNERLNTINKVDNCILSLVSIQYLDMNISEEIKANLSILIDDMNTFVRKYNKDKNEKSYKKFSIENMEGITVAKQRETGEIREIARKKIRRNLANLSKKLKGTAPDIDKDGKVLKDSDYESVKEKRKRMKEEKRRNEEEDERPKKKDKEKKRRRDDDDDDKKSSKKDKEKKKRRRDEDDDKPSKKDRNKKEKKEKNKDKGDKKMGKLEKALKGIKEDYKKDLKSVKMWDDFEDIMDNPKEKKILKFLEELTDEDKKLAKKLKGELEDVVDFDDDDEDDKKSSKKDKNKKKDKGGNEVVKYLNVDAEDLGKLISDIVDEHGKEIKKINKKLLSKLEDMADEVEDDEDLVPVALGMLLVVSNSIELDKKIAKKLVKLTNISDEDDEDDKKSSKRDKKKNKSGKFEDAKELLEDLVKDNKSELKDEDLFDDVKEMISDIEDDDADKKDIKKLVSKLMKKAKKLDAKKLIGKLADELGLSDDEDDDDNDRKSSRKNRDKKDKSKNKKNKIDFDDLDLGKKDVKKLEKMIDKSDLGKSDLKKAEKFVDKEKWEELYDLASEEDSDLASDLKDFFRGLARVSSSDDSDLSDYFISGSIGKYKVVNSFEDVENGTYDLDDLPSINAKTLDCFYEVSVEKVPTSVPYIVLGSLNKNKRVDNRFN